MPIWAILSRFTVFWQGFNTLSRYSHLLALKTDLTDLLENLLAYISLPWLMLTFALAIYIRIMRNRARLGVCVEHWWLQSG